MLKGAMRDIQLIILGQKINVALFRMKSVIESDIIAPFTSTLAGEVTCEFPSSALSGEHNLPHASNTASLNGKITAKGCPSTPTLT